MNRQLLNQPFDSKYIKQRKGRNGMMLDYLETHMVIQRLNESLEGNWSFEIVEHQQMGDEVVVLGKLTADGISKMQFGSSNIARAKSDNAVISIGDDLKSAASDALKKCATLLGVGLHLYGELADTATIEDESAGKVDDTARSDRKSGRKSAKTTSKVSDNTGDGTHSTNGDTSGDATGESGKPKMENMTGNLGSKLITKEQLAQIKKVRTERNLSVEDVQAKCKTLFGTTDVTSLNPIMATALIAVIGNNGDNGK